MVEADQFIDSAKQVQKKLEEEAHVSIKPHVVISIMRDDLGLKYRKIKEVALH